MNYSKGMQKARLAAGLSKRKLASLTGFAPSYIGLLESGKRTPSLDAINLIAKSTGIPVGLLLLFCSEAEDLAGINVKQAQKLAKQLLELCDLRKD